MLINMVKTFGLKEGTIGRDQCQKIPTPKTAQSSNLLFKKYDPDDDLMCGAKAALGAGEAALKQVGTGFHLQLQQQQQQQRATLMLLLLVV